MTKAEGAGLGISVVAHVLLFAILSLGIVTRVKLPPLKAEAVDVVLVDKIGLQTQLPQPSREEPAPAKAPEPTPAPPAPSPPPPAPAPEPKPTPPAPAPKPAPAPEPKPAPVPRPAPAPKPARRSSDVPETGPSSEAAPAPKPQPRPAPRSRERVTQEDRRRPDMTHNRVESRTTSRAPNAGRLAGVLAGISDGAGRAPAPRAAISQLAMQGLNAAIKRQVQPCYELGALAGTPAMRIVTVLRLRFNRDGTVSGTPAVEEQSGVDESNASYKQQIVDVARRAVLRCSPLRLPPELYDVGDGQGWNDIEFTFRPGEFG